MTRDSRGWSVFAALVGTSDLVVRQASHPIAARGLSLAQYDLLRTLAGSRGQQLETQVVARRMMARVPSVTRLVDRLEDRGLLRRQRCSQDRRVVWLHLMDAGIALLDELEYHVDLAIAEALEALDLEQQEDLRTLLDHLGASMRPGDPERATDDPCEAEAPREEPKTRGDLGIMKKTFLGLIALSLVALPALAQAATWEIDNTHTTVSFKVRHLLTKVTGTFTEVAGTIEFDPDKPTAGSASVTIPVAGIDTRNEKRDGHLKSPDFFDAENHPNLTFKGTKFVKTDDGLKLEGLLTMRGVEKPVTLDVEFLGSQPGMGGGMVAGFSASTKVNRQDFGISWNRALDQGGAVLSDDVEIMIDIEANTEG